MFNPPNEFGAAALKQQTGSAYGSKLNRGRLQILVSVIGGEINFAELSRTDRLHRNEIASFNFHVGKRPFDLQVVGEYKQ